MSVELAWLTAKCWHVQSMQDWLNERGLDRKRLQGLAANVTAVEEYEANAYTEVRVCVQSILGVFAPPQELVSPLHPQS